MLGARSTSAWGASSGAEDEPGSATAGAIPTPISPGTPDSTPCAGVTGCGYVAVISPGATEGSVETSGTPATEGAIDVSGATATEGAVDASGTTGTCTSKRSTM